jgi:hypothetical protein
MNSSLTPQFGFDDWAELAARDPQEFEALRQQTIDAVIERAQTARQRRRLQGLQWRIDMVRQQAKTPLAACVHMYSMMWDKVLGEDGMLEVMEPFRSVRANTASAAPPPATGRQRAQVIPFPGPARTDYP